MSTKAIEAYLRNHYTDERLAVLLAHAEDGRLAYQSCCCFIGVATASHRLYGRREMEEMIDHYSLFGTNWTEFTPHLVAARQQPGAIDAEKEFFNLGSTDTQRREKIIPLIKAEIARRDTEREQMGDHYTNFREVLDGVTSR